MDEGEPQKLNWNRLLLIGVVLSAIIVGVMLYHAVSALRSNVDSANSCRMGIRCVAQAAESYEALSGQWPRDVGQLADGMPGGPPLLLKGTAVCSVARADGLPEPHYAIAPGLRNGMPDSYVLVYELHHVHGGKRHVCFVHGRAEFWGRDRDAELEQRLEAQRQATKPGRGP